MSAAFGCSPQRKRKKLQARKGRNEKEIGQSLHTYLGDGAGLLLLELLHDRQDGGRLDLHSGGDLGSLRSGKGSAIVVLDELGALRTEARFTRGYVSSTSTHEPHCAHAKR